MGDSAKQCRLGLFQDSDFAGDLEDSKSTSGRTLCIFGSHTVVPISWMCKKQTAVSHSSTESAIISLDTGLRLDGLLALELWDRIVSVLGNVSRVSDRSWQPDNDVHKHHKSQKKINVLENIDSVPSNVQSSRQEALLYVFEDNEAVIKMIIKRRSPTMRHVSRTHRVALDRLFDRINLDSKIQIKYIDTKKQLAHILTTGNFTRDEWNHLLSLFNISHFSSTVCSDTVAKRSQQDSGGERVTAKSRPMMNLVARTRHPEIWVQEIPLLIRLKEDLQWNCAETVMRRANGSMEDVFKGQSTKIPLGKFTESCTHGGREELPNRSLISTTS